VNQRDLSSTFDPDGPETQKARRRVANPWLLRAFMFTKLPLALFAGLRVRSLDRRVCEVTVPYGWMTTNPFKSTYFAVLAMAAEMSTGALGLALVETGPEPVSFLIVGMDAKFTKKAADLTTFRCEDGEKFVEAYLKTLATGESTKVTAETIGVNKAGDEVARFNFTWSFKRKRA